MKKYTLILLLLLMLPVHAGAQGNVPPGMNVQFEAFDTAVTTHQVSEHAIHGRYLQYLTRAPDDTGPTCPNDQATCPEIPGLSPAVLDFVVNIYTIPLGNGYECVAIYHGPSDQDWRRVINHGPETWRNSDWEPISVQGVENAR